MSDPRDLEGQGGNGSARELNRVEARAGSTPGVTRYVLAVSMLLIVAAFAALLIYAG